MKKNILILTFSLILVIGISLAAFAEPVTLYYNLGADPPTLDPTLASDTTSVDVIEQLFVGLTDFDVETMEVIPGLPGKFQMMDWFGLFI
jgi:oligopeptide transport system substrate-binding protein